MLKFNEKDSHSNVLIVDDKLKKIELYEPHGIKFLSDEIIFNNEIHIKNLVSVILQSRSRYNFTNVHYQCRLGLQAKQNISNVKSAHCVAWTLFFIHIKMYNLDKTSEELVEFFEKFKSKDLQTQLNFKDATL